MNSLVGRRDRSTIKDFAEMLPTEVPEKIADLLENFGCTEKAVKQTADNPKGNF